MVRRFWRRVAVRLRPGRPTPTPTPVPVFVDDLSDRPGLPLVGCQVCEPDRPWSDEHLCRWCIARLVHGPIPYTLAEDGGAP